MYVYIYIYTYSSLFPSLYLSLYTYIYMCIYIYIYRHVHGGPHARPHGGRPDHDDDIYAITLDNKTGNTGNQQSTIIDTTNTIYKQVHQVI